MILGSDFSVSLYQAFTFFFNLDVVINCKVILNEQVFLQVWNSLLVLPGTAAQ